MSQVFISYRRDDSADVTGRIYDRLVQRYGRDNVFKDVDDIPLGADFRAAISEAVGRCQVLLAVIGRQWLDIAGPSGGRRLDDPRDFVRLEIEAALGRGIPVIPVLVSRAVMPGDEQLPPSLQPLAFRNGLVVRWDPDFDHDVGRLLNSLARLLPGPTLPPAHPVTTPTRPPAVETPPAKSPLELIRDLIDAEHFEQAWTEYRRLPHERRRPALLKELQDRWRTHAHALARDAAETDHDFAAAVALIEKLPEPLRDAAVLDDYRATRDRLVKLRADIDEDVENHRHTFRLRTRVAEYRRLKPDDPAINELHQALGDVPKEITNSLRMKFVLVSAGTCWMGDRGSQRQVQIPRDYYVGAFPVTQEQWQAVMGSNPSHFSRSGSGADKVKGISDADLKQFPIESVSWDDAQEFLKRLNAREKDGGFLYRLPAEAEWEYSCRGRASSEKECAFDFYFGDPSRNLSQPTNDLSSEQANFNGNHPAGNAPKGKSVGRTTKVGSYQPNRLGLYDLHGNVWEWCEDPYEAGGSARVVRGGGWGHHGAHCRASFRGRNEPSYRYNDVGLRLAAVPSGE